MSQNYKDYPVVEVLANMERLIKSGHKCWVKFTCAGCGSRQTDSEPNRYCTGGYTCEECGHLTIPTGINFMAVLATKTGSMDEVNGILKRPK